MFILKKRFKQMEKRIADLEAQVQNQQSTLDLKVDSKEILEVLNRQKLLAHRRGVTSW